jgi:asparagine synthase (glutamine-hydrolysing)
MSCSGGIRGIGGSFAPLRSSMCSRRVGLAGRQGCLEPPDSVLAPQTTLDRHLDWVTARRRYARADMYGERLSGQLQSDHAIASLFPHITDFEGELDADAFMQLDQRHWLPDDVLTKSDRAGMLNSLEIRTPYLARDVAEFANSVNAATHLGGWGKRLLRASAAELLPDRTARWRKRAFRVPCRQWLEGPLRDLVEHQVRHGALVEGGFIDPGFALETFKQHEAGHDRTSLLWPMLAFGLWLDGRASLRTF